MASLLNFTPDYMVHALLLAIIQQAGIPNSIRDSERSSGRPPASTDNAYKFLFAAGQEMHNNATGD